jgi:hypothetical protein
MSWLRARASRINGKKGGRPRIIVESKRCASCGQVLPLSDFYTRKRNNRLIPRAYCKKCGANSFKELARKYLRRAVLYGLIKKPNACQLCKKQFSSAMIHGHHINYCHPTDVMWLCQQCHRTFHRGKSKQATEENV